MYLFLNTFCFLFSVSLYLQRNQGVHPLLCVFLLYFLNQFVSIRQKSTYKDFFLHEPFQFLEIKGSFQSNQGICYSCSVSVLTVIWCQYAPQTTTPRVQNFLVAIQGIGLTCLSGGCLAHPITLLASFLFQWDGFSKSHTEFCHSEPMICAWSINHVFSLFRCPLWTSHTFSHQYSSHMN